MAMSKRNTRSRDIAAVSLGRHGHQYTSTSTAKLITNYAGGDNKAAMLFLRTASRHSQPIYWDKKYG